MDLCYFEFFDVMDLDFDIFKGCFFCFLKEFYFESFDQYFVGFYVLILIVWGFELGSIMDGMNFEDDLE